MWSAFKHFTFTNSWLIQGGVNLLYITRRLYKVSQMCLNDQDRCTLCGPQSGCGSWTNSTQHICSCASQVWWSELKHYWRFPQDCNCKLVAQYPALANGTSFLHVLKNDDDSVKVTPLRCVAEHYTTDSNAGRGLY